MPVVDLFWGSRQISVRMVEGSVLTVEEQIGDVAILEGSDPHAMESTELSVKNICQVSSSKDLACLRNEDSAGGWDRIRVLYFLNAGSIYEEAISVKHRKVMFQHNFFELR